MTNGSPFARLEVHARRLANGLSVLVCRDASAPVAAVVAHVRAGYFDDPDGAVGVSHLLEHLYFRRAGRPAEGGPAREVRAAGGFLNAVTSYDRTCYGIVLPSRALELAVELHASALRHAATFDDADALRREVAVIVQEAKRKRDTPEAAAAEALFAAAFDVHPLRRWRIGTDEGLARITCGDVREFHRRAYAPGNVVLCVAGDVEPERVLERVEHHFGSIAPRRRGLEARPAEPERAGFRLARVAGGASHGRVDLGWRTPGTLHPDTPALGLLSLVLGRGRESRLFRGLCRSGPATTAGSFHYTPTELGVFSASAGFPGPLEPRAVEALWSVVDGVRAHGVTPAEAGRARTLAEAELVRRLETVEGTARLLAEWEALGGWGEVERYRARLLAATSEELAGVASRYLALESATALVTHTGEASAPAWSPAAVEAALRAAPAAVLPACEAPAPRRRARRAWEEVGEEDGVHFFRLANGVRIAVRPRPSAAMAAMGVFARGGVCRETRERAGITRLMARASVGGGEGASAEALGGAVSPLVTSDDAFCWALSVPARHLEAGFGMVAEAAFRPAFPAAVVERERDRALAGLQRLRDDMFRYPLQLCLQCAFPDHPYGFGVEVTEAALRGTSRGDVVRWHRAQLLRGEPWVVVVGDVDPRAVAGVVAREATRVGRAATPAEPGPPRWPAEQRREETRRARAQTAFALAFPAPPRAAGHAAVMEVLEGVVSGPGGRFFEELRGRRSLAYSVSAFAVTHRCAGAFVAYAATSPDREDDAREALLAEFRRLASDGVGAAEVERARAYAAGMWEIRSQTTTAQLRLLADALILGDGPAELRRHREQLGAVSPGQVNALVREWFDPGRVVEGVVRGG